jgi:hypothetical protein
MSINRQEFTNAGRDMLGRANAGETLAITGVVIGSGRANAPADLWPRTELFNHEMNVVIIQQVDQGDGILLVDAAFNSSQAPNAFELCELGVMAHIGTEADRLYSVANVLATGADNVDPAVESIHAFKIKVVIDRAPNVTVVIGTSGDILVENIGAETVGPGWFKEKIGNTLRFKRPVAGYGIELTENPLDPFTVTIAQKVLTTDLDLYVPLTHPSGTPVTRFSSIQDALDYLRPINIPPERTARINVDTFIQPITSPIRIEHPQSDRIEVLGTQGPETAITFVAFPGGSAGAYTLNINVIDSTPFAVGDYVIIFGHSGNVALLNGFYRITLVGSGFVQILFPYYRPGLAEIGAVTAFMRKMSSLIRVDVDAVNAVEIYGNGLKLFRHFGLVGRGANSGDGLAVHRNANLEWIGSTGFKTAQGRGLLFTGGSSSIDSCYVTDNQTGIYISGVGTVLAGNNCFINHNTAFNWRNESAYVILSACRGHACHAGSGLACNNQGWTQMGNCYFGDNATDGVSVSMNSNVVVAANSLLYARANFSLIDIRLTLLSGLNVSGIIDFGTTNQPFPMRLSDDGCYFNRTGPAEGEQLPEIGQQPILEKNDGRN